MIMSLRKKKQSWFRSWLEFIVMYLVIFPVGYVTFSRNYFFENGWKLSFIIYIAGSILALFLYKYDFEW